MLARGAADVGRSDRQVNGERERNDLRVMADAILRPIAVDALPEWSPWPARLLGLSDMQQQRRTPEHIDREFNVDKYGPLLAAFQQDPGLSLDQIRRIELGDPDRGVAMSIGDRLFGTTLAHAVDRLVSVQLEHIAGVAAQTGAVTVVDLGCGYGHLLARLRSRLGGLELRGGEYAQTGVALAERLHRDDDLLTVEPFDFLSGETCRPLEAARAPVVVVTSFALHQLPSAAPAIALLHQYRDRVAAVVTFEPEDRLFGGSLLGLLRLRYQRINDYSADLLRQLYARDDIEVNTVVPNAIGVNALLPGTVAVWRFVR